MYGHEYPDAAIICNNLIGFHHDVYRLARYYYIPRLQYLAFESFKYRANSDFDAYYFVRVLRKGDYRSDLEMYEALIERCHEEIRDLCDNVHFHAVLRKDPELGIELAQSFGKSLLKYHCSKCMEAWSMDRTVLSPLFCPHCGHHEENWDSYL